MQITTELGQEIIERLSEYIEVDINIMDLNGKIVASTDSSRISQIHSGALKVIQNQQSVILTEKDVINFPGTKQGVNLPILHQNKIKGVVGVSGNPAAIKQITSIIRASVEITLEQINIQRQAYFKERQWSHWVHQLLHPMGFEIEQLEEDAIYSLTINPKQSWRLLVFTGDDIHDCLDPIRQELLGAKINNLLTLPYLGNEIIVAIDPVFDRIDDFVNKIINHSKKQVHVGVGNVEFGIKGIRESYFQAKKSLAFASANSNITYIEDKKLERLIASIPDQEYNAVCKNYEILLHNLDKEYLNTIEVYLSMNFSIKETAGKLHIHRNTLQYRLDQLKEKIGLDPRSVYDAFILTIILRTKI
ncbi:CdaR family transcriptional regulator [Virgibacillus sp. DJP39]|uniref:CdaR family transcriptional regulator n=1 Tax=Virgibacillus sp. DJP39 TaxID=3409790 RepID=UPI003BB535E2